ncbi:unnamed protein product [Ilex paraguariensis]|uniref:Peptide deformylase n=1 Tax=Ilex paraguariensis TaxID=185542 RepID=A0ABC8RB48_9AQUA
MRIFILLHLKGMKRSARFRNLLVIHQVLVSIVLDLPTKNFRLRTGFDREGRPIKVDASGWQARILQYKCDHLERILYVGKMVPRTFKVVENLSLPLPAGSHFLGNLLGSISPW